MSDPAPGMAMKGYTGCVKIFNNIHKIAFSIIQLGNVNFGCRFSNRMAQIQTNLFWPSALMSLGNLWKPVTE